MDRDKEVQKLLEMRKKLANTLEMVKENDKAIFSVEWVKKNILNIK